MIDIICAAIVFSPLLALAAIGFAIMIDMADERARSQECDAPDSGVIGRS